jgi:hypothetical protein
MHPIWNAVLTGLVVDAGFFATGVIQRKVATHEYFRQV